MASSKKHLISTRWFFLLVAAIILFLSWKIAEPFAVTLVTASVFAITLSPVEKRLRKRIKHPKISTFIMVLGAFLIIVLPLFLLGVLLVDQAQNFLGLIRSGDTFLTGFDVRSFGFFSSLPSPIQEWLLSLDIAEIGRSTANWVIANVQAGLSNVVGVVMNTFVFFIALYYILLDREKLHKELLVLSPLKDALDDKIVNRITSTVRNVIFGALIVAFIQAILATIGMTIFGVPGALLWGMFVIIAAQVPLFGVGLVMVPAAIYLAVTGDIGSAIGLLIFWAVVIVGLIDNLVAPQIVQGRTKMHALLILISILGGLQFFGPIGFVLGPTILAAFLTIIELYKSGIIESNS